MCKYIIYIHITCCIESKQYFIMDSYYNVIKIKLSKLKQTKMKETYGYLMEHKCKNVSSYQER